MWTRPVKTLFFAFLFVLALIFPSAHAELDSLLDNAPDGGPVELLVNESTEVSPTTVSARRGEVARAAFTTAIVDREPQGTISELTTKISKVYYFTELSNMMGRRIIHRWEYNGKVMAEIPFEVGGPRWRIYSAKSLLPAWTGEWTAATVDEDGRVLALNTLEYKP